MVQKSLKKREGQSLVETALVMPILILLFTVIIDFGLLFNNYLMVSNASREGARSAAIGNTDALVNTTVSNVAASLDPTRLTVTITPDETTGRLTGDAVTVSVQYQYTMLTPIVAAFIPGPFQLETSTTMRCE